ncbi:Sir2 family NAD-dependent protein deacetylase [Povalibacter sp.]|uniref:SIR2 family NAD-dependent protein deacylase n=1 Tax=Povalibacter sp. TaxID=1962978 RepID=UPI002F4175E0
MQNDPNDSDNPGRSASPDPEPAQAEALRKLLDASRHVVFFTGAGISTESGIPDFRSPGGVWTKMQPIYYQEFIASEATRREAWRRRFQNTDGWVGAEPNAGHRAIAQLIKDGKAASVITQNVDNLHQASGVPDDKVIELHGNSTYATCLTCHARYELVDIEKEFRSTGTVAPCSRCGGVIKSATISFGQQMPALPMQRAHDQTMRCDLFIVLGSSLSVFPAADFPLRARQKGAALVIVNRDPTQVDDAADLVIHAGIGATMTRVVG